MRRFLKILIHPAERRAEESPFCHEVHEEPPFAPCACIGTMNPIVLVLVVLLGLENA